MTYETITLERDGPVAVLTLNRPKRLNAMSRPTLEEMLAACDEVERDDALRTLVLTGATDDEEQCRRALRRWLTAVARREFGPRLQSLSLALELPYRRMQVRAQRTCWGSHSSTGTISINLCLLFVPASVVRYLFVHELCHGRHMNHSASFWRLVRRHEPAYRRLDRELGDAWRNVPGWVGIY